MSEPTTLPVDTKARWAELTVEELRELAALNRANPDGAIECDPSLWSPEVDDDVWSITEAEDGHELDLPSTPEEPAYVPSPDDERWLVETSIDRDDQPGEPWVPATSYDGPPCPALGHFA